MKAQSAVEYLMTYGWSILIIAVVIASLVELGVFNSVNTSPSSCIGVTGYSCSNPTLYASGALITKLGQVSTGPITITGTACTKNSTVTSIIPVASTQLQSEQQTQIIFHCPLASSATGSQFTGHLWIEYSTASQQDVIQEVGVVQTPVVSSNTVAYAPIAYIAGDSGVYSVNLASYTITNSISMGQLYSYGPTAIAVSPDGQNIYTVQDPITSALDTITTSTFTVTNEIAGFAGTLEHIAVSSSGQYAYISNYYADTFTTVNLASNLVTNTITMASPQGLALSPDNSYAYVSGTSNFYTIDLATDTITNTISGFGDADAVAVSSDGQFAYVSDCASSIDTINLVSDTITNTIALPQNGYLIMITDSGPYNSGCAIALSPNGKTAYVTYGGTSTLYEVNLSTDTLSNTLSTFNGALVADAVSSDGQYVYAAAFGGRYNLYTINTTTFTVVNALPVEWGTQDLTLFTPTQP